MEKATVNALVKKCSIFQADTTFYIPDVCQKIITDVFKGALLEFAINLYGADRKAVTELVKPCALVCVCMYVTCC